MLRSFFVVSSIMSSCGWSLRNVIRMPRMSGASSPWGSMMAEIPAITEKTVEHSRHSQSQRSGTDGRREGRTGSVELPELPSDEGRDVQMGLESDAKQSAESRAS